MSNMHAAASEPGRDARGSFFQMTHTLRSIVNHPSTLVKDQELDEKKVTKRKGKAKKSNSSKSKDTEGWPSSSDESDDAGITAYEWSTRPSELERPGSSLSGAGEPASPHTQPPGAIVAAVPMEVSSAPVAAALANQNFGVAVACEEPEVEDNGSVGSLQERRARLVKAAPEIQTPTIEQSSKMLLAIEIIKQASARNEKLLFFSHRLDLLDLMQFFLEAIEFRKGGGFWQRGTHYHRLDGADSAEDRHHVAEKFNSPSTDLRLLLLSTKAVGLGLNLIGASRVILFDLDWDPTVDMQAIFRTYRCICSCIFWVMLRSTKLSWSQVRPASTRDCLSTARGENR